MRIIIITQSLRTDPCDCVRQTALQLVKKKIPVEIIWLAERQSAFHFIRRSFLRDKKTNFYSNREFIESFVVKLFPFERFTSIKNLNTLINLFFFLLKNKRSDQTLYWIFEPFLFAPLNKLFKGKKIYDCIDNFSVLSPELNRLEKKLIAFVDVVFTCNKTLYAEMKKKTSKARQVPQGFDEESFRPYKNSLEKKVEFTSSLTFIFAGTICTRFDFSLLFSVIEDQPECRFLFVGPILKNFQPTETFDSDIKHLLSFKNVQYLGVKNREDVAKLIKNSDVGIIPYDIKKPFNHFSLPLKTLEYFYFGLPVFATPTPEMKNLDDLVFRFKNSSEFCKNLNILEKSGWSSSKRVRQRHFAQSQSWEKKIDRMLEITKPL